MSPILTTTDLTKGWGAVQAVQTVNLKFEKGCRHAIIGPKGAGKTTRLHFLAGALTADRGQVVYNGQDVTMRSQAQRVRQGIVRSFQRRRRVVGLTVLESGQWVFSHLRDSV